MRYRVLLVDDEPNVLGALRRELGGHAQHAELPFALDLHCFEQPAAALRAAQSQAFDLVISDYRMPEMDGVELLSELILLQPGIARLILSGQTDLQGLLGAINRAQIFRFIAKPWDAYDLRTTVRQALEHRELLRENRRLADLIRVQRGELSPQEMELRRIEEQFPELSRTRKD